MNNDKEEKKQKCMKCVHYEHTEEICNREKLGYPYIPSKLFGDCLSFKEIFRR